MTSKLLIAVSVIFLSLSLAAPAATDPKSYTGKGLAPAHLRCEYLVDPLGIGEPAPRLSWIVESGERGQRQTACRLLVASSEKAILELGWKPRYTQLDEIVRTAWVWHQMRYAK